MKQKSKEYIERLNVVDRKIKKYNGINELLNQNEKNRQNSLIENVQTSFKEKNVNCITFLNTFSYYALLDCDCPVNNINTILLDGKLQVILHNIFHVNKVNRASFDFSSIAHEFFEYVQDKELGIAIVGAEVSENNCAMNNLIKKYPGLRVVYSRHGYFNSEYEKQSTYNNLKENNPDVIILGMGTPEQEKYAIYLANQGLQSIIITCGGFITQTSKNIDYYNPIIKKLSLRWLQRIIQFSHVRKRLFIDYPKNVVRYFLEHL
jgi:N-acetylglucosaminyldiphosphoundecaprenol N-acetyl-beta-D-mannosaminyltransferase